MFNFEIRLETFVNECFFGPFGFLNHDISVYVPDDPLDCVRRRYEPELPLFKAGILNAWDFVFEYLEWQCNYSDKGPPAPRFEKESGGETEFPEEIDLEEPDIDPTSIDFVGDENTDIVIPNNEVSMLWSIL